MKTSNSAPKGKEMAEKSGSFAKGGTTKMFGQQGADAAKPGTSSVNPASANNKFGLPSNVGKTGVMGKQGGATPAIAGQSSVGGKAGDNSFKVSGGAGKMFGNTGSTPAKPR